MAATVLQILLVRLRELRLEKGWPQEQFAEGSGLTYKHYQAVEAGRKADLRLSTLERIALAHEIHVWELLKPRDNSGDSSGAFRNERAREH